MSDRATTRPAPTPGQTVGPFFGYALPYPAGEQLVPYGHPGAVRLHGRILDGEDQPVPDALVEIWQADPAGQVVRQAGSLHRDGYTFTGWGRTPTDAVGRYSFTTLEPGRVELGTDRAPFIAMTVFARGLMHRLFTRVYRPEGEALDTDPFLLSVEVERRRTLIARREPDGSLGFDVRLQGDQETVFLSFDR
jgi:protocatechuate 3,4-dioxygenase alpha subunit